MDAFYPLEAYGELAKGIRDILYTEEQIRQRVRELGQAISDDYRGLDPLLVGVLKGVVPFMADLLRSITIPVEVDVADQRGCSARIVGGSHGHRQAGEASGDHRQRRDTILVVDIGQIVRGRRDIL